MKLSFQSVLTLLRTHWIFLVILLLGFGLRVYRLPQMASYDFDQEFVTNFVLDVVRIYPIRFIGQGLSVEGLFMGPWYFYALVPFYVLAGLSPLGGSFGSVIFGLGIIWAYYFVGKKLFSHEVGYVAAFLRATSFSAIAADWSMVPSYTSDIVILALLLLFYWLWKWKANLAQINWKQSIFWILPSIFFLFGMLTSFHPVHFHFGLVFLLLWVFWRVRFSWKNWLAAFCAFLLPVSPLMVFEYIRRFAMTKQILEMFTGGNAGSKSEEFSLERVSYIGKAALGHWLEIWVIGKEYRLVGVITLLLLFAVFFWQIKKHRLKELTFFVPTFGFSIFVTLLYYLFFPTHVPEYYLRSLQVIFFLVLSATLIQLWHMRQVGKVFAVILLTILLWRNGVELQKAWEHPTNIRLADKQAVVQHILRQTQGTPFQVSYVTEPGWQYGYKSLFRVAQTEPGEEGPVYTIVAPATFVEVSELDFRAGNVGVNYPD